MQQVWLDSVLLHFLTTTHGIQSKCLQHLREVPAKLIKDAVGAKWAMDEEIPASVADMVVMDATNDVEKIAESVDFVFCAVDMKKTKSKLLKKDMLRLNALLFQTTLLTVILLTFR